MIVLNWVIHIACVVFIFQDLDRAAKQEEKIEKQKEVIKAYQRSLKDCERRTWPNDNHQENND